MAKILAIETTCDETAAAVFTDEPSVLSNVVASQSKLHERFGGVVPEIAARAHLTQVLPIIDEALRQAQTSMDEIDAIAVAYTPGLIGAILIGLTAAKTLAWSLGKPLLGVNHLNAHIYACQMSATESVYPCIGFVVSGGHTNLFYCKTGSDIELVGSTTDDAAGEAFDKVASILGLGYPGGPNIEKAARSGDPKKYDFPRSFLHEDRLDFSFSGIKTSVRYLVQGQDARNPKPPLPAQAIADIAASFQQAVIDVLVAKARKAARQYGVGNLCVGGGVAANSMFRAELEVMARKEDLKLAVPPLRLCTDNAAMAAVAIEKFRNKQFDALDLDAVAGLVRMS